MSMVWRLSFKNPLLGLAKVSWEGGISMVSPLKKVMSTRPWYTRWQRMPPALIVANANFNLLVDIFVPLALSCFYFCPCLKQLTHYNLRNSCSKVKDIFVCDYLAAVSQGMSRYFDPKMCFRSDAFCDMTNLLTCWHVISWHDPKP